MSTATDEATDLEQSLDEVLPCKIPSCETPAEWQLLCRHCRYRYSIYCGEHIRMFHALTELMAAALTIVCDGCGQTGPDLLSEYPI